MSRFVLLANRFILWLSKHWLAAFNTLAFLYVGLALLAPILMQAGLEGPARIIYTVYRSQCHQLPQRSWFLFGPRIAYRLPELMERAGDAVSDPWARSFVGSEALGYKMAFCQRDTAIFGAILLSGLVYGVLRTALGREVHPIAWWVYVGLGLAPMAIDGGYQFLSYALPLLFSSSPITPYEATPLMRTLTGVLFGWATVWLTYPYVQEAMDDIRRSLQQRLGSES